MEEANEYAKESFRLKDDVNEMAAKMVSSQSDAIIEKFKSELQAEKKSNLVALNEKDKKIRTTRTSAMKMSASSMQGVILVARERNRNMETSITATHCGIQLTKDMQDRMEYAWAYARFKEEQGQKGCVARMLPGMDEDKRQTVQRETGSSAAAAVAVEAHFETARSSSSKKSTKTICSAGIQQSKEAKKVEKGEGSCARGFAQR